jgi:hypothetical protein
MALGVTHSSRTAMISKISRLSKMTRADIFHEETLVFKLEDLINSSSTKKADYCQVLCIYKRSTLADQVECLMKQTALPSKILIYHNSNHVKNKSYFSSQRWESATIQYTHNENWNAKYHGRFYACLPVKSPWYIVWDDDLIPGKDWNRSCLDKAKRLSAIVTANGRILNPDWLNNFSVDLHEYGIGSFDPISQDTVVDYGGHAWTFARKNLIDMASIEPPSLTNSEDFHLSAASYIKSNTQTIVHSPLGTDDVPDLLNGQWASDQHASWITRADSYQAERRMIIREWLQSYGYTPLAYRQASSQIGSIPLLQ